MRLRTAEVAALPLNSDIVTPGGTTWTHVEPGRWVRLQGDLTLRSSAWVAKHVQAQRVDHADAKAFRVLGNLLSRLDGS